VVNSSIAWCKVGTMVLGGEVDGAPDEDHVHGPFRQHALPQ
jgi:hypothetical protein